MTREKVNVQKKIIFSTFSALRKTAELLERAPRISKKDVAKAETFEERDKIARLWAAYCYDLAEYFAGQKKFKLQLQWMKLAARLLHLSLKPKKLVDLDEIKKVLAEIKREQAVAK